MAAPPPSPPCRHPSSRDAPVSRLHTSCSHFFFSLRHSHTFNNNITKRHLIDSLFTASHPHQPSSLPSLPTPAAPSKTPAPKHQDENRPHSPSGWGSEVGSRRRCSVTSTITSRRGRPGPRISMTCSIRTATACARERAFVSAMFDGNPVWHPPLHPAWQPALRSRPRGRRYMSMDR